ncbi:MFS transporter [Nonomuraea typhae]|uniref:MFS transporter n=1 Tax=Nonomuraea typhae TaxID=2603600 RepID=UPI001FEA4837|nr:MFS transporter [Nonomuraea typhae]
MSIVAQEVSLKEWLAVIAVAVGTFAMVTVEQLPVGLLTAIGGSLNISEGAAGLMVTVPGLVASATAPLLPVAIGRLDRRTVLIGLLSLMVVANAVSVVAPNFAIMLASRFLVGIGIGGFWALAAGIAVRLVPAQHVARATSLAFGGATAANVLGIPAGTLIGNLSDWRVAFAAVGVLALLVVGALAWLLPRIPASAPVRLAELPRQFRNPVVRAAVISTFLVVSGQYAAFTFVSPILQNVSGVPADLIGPILLGFGVAGVIGTFVGSSWNVKRRVITLSVVLAAIMVLFPLVGTTPVTGTILLIIWGLAYGGAPVAVQTWILQGAGESAEAATALNTTVFNLAIAFGAAFGGIVADNLAVTGALWIGALLMALTAAAAATVSARRGVPASRG